MGINTLKCFFPLETCQIPFGECMSKLMSYFLISIIMEKNHTCDAKVGRRSKDRTAIAVPGTLIN